MLPLHFYGEMLKSLFFFSSKYIKDGLNLQYMIEIAKPFIYNKLHTRVICPHNSFSADLHINIILNFLKDFSSATAWPVFNKLYLEPAAEQELRIVKMVVLC